MISKTSNIFQSLDSNVKQVLQKGAGAFAVRIVGAVAAFIVNIYLARVLDPNGFGLFSLALTIVSMLAIFSLFGLDSIVLRDIAKDNEGKNNGHARAVADPALRLVSLLSLILMTVLILIAPWIAKVVFSKPQLSPIIIAMSPIVIFLSAGYLISAGLKAISQTKSGMFVQAAFLPLVFLAAYFSVSVFVQLSVKEIAWLYSGMSIFVLVLSYGYWKSLTVEAKDTRRKNAIWLIKKGWPFLLMSSGWFLLTSTDVIVLGIFDNEIAVGIYSASSKLALLTGFILVAVNAVVAPKFSNLYSCGDLIGLKKLSKQTTRIMIGLVIIPTIPFLFIPELILSVFGQKFIAGAMVLVVLTMGQFLNISFGVTGTLLSMTGHEIIIRNIILGTVLFNMGLSIMLVINMGLIGAAIATAISMVVWSGLGLLAVRKHFGFWML